VDVTHYSLREHWPLLAFAELAALLAVARYINKNSIEDEMLFCKSLKTRTTGEYIFNLVDFYLKEKGPPWDKCTDICTAGAKSVTGKYCVFIVCVQSILPEIGIDMIYSVKCSCLYTRWQ
jgi:hypothetical protein